jgi:5-formyltetrahydrofolate cyclo-ligase
MEAKRQVESRTDLAQLKAALRVRMQARLTSMDATMGARFTERIFDRLTRLPEFENARSVLAYVSMMREVGTHNLIRHCLMAGKTVCVPAFDRERKLYFAVAIEDFERDLGLGHYGILEPRDARPTTKNADIAIIPGLAFDRAGNRLGRGKGYFDQLLRGFRGTKIALAFGFQCVDSVPANTDDVPMDFVVTEEQVVRCAR